MSTKKPSKVKGKAVKKVAVEYTPTLVDIALNLRQDLQADFAALQSDREAFKDKQASIEREMHRVDGGLATLTVLLSRVENADNKAPH